MNLIPEGFYSAELISADITESKNGSPRVSCEFRITDGDYKDRTVYEDLYLTPAALKSTMEKLEALGFVGDDVAAVKGCVGKVARIGVQVEAESENARGRSLPARNRVGWIGESKKRRELDGADAARVIANVNAQLAALGAKKGKTPPPASAAKSNARPAASQRQEPAGGAAQRPDDDIPF